MNHPTIVIVAFNRPYSITRLLDSVSNGKYEFDNIPLIISIDSGNCDNHLEVVRIAKEFNWKFGSKEIILHSKNLGLREHVLTCGDLVEKYNSIIMLEDDLYVSPNYYNYAYEALKYYENCDRIAGISLYNHKKNFVAGLPFEIIPDSNDVYFLQIAASWGQCWNKKQWNNFRSWYTHNKSEILSKSPLVVRSWPDSSWLKYFIEYLVVNNLYFVYPNKSLSTNFGDGGTHNKNKNVESQVPLFMGENLNFIKIEDSLNIYDSYFEILPQSLNNINHFYSNYNYSIDLYGKKELDNIKTEYLISSKTVKNYELVKNSFGLELKPQLLNIINKIPGNTFSLSSKENFEDGETQFNVRNNAVLNYFYTKLDLKMLLAVILLRIKSKFFKM